MRASRRGDLLLVVAAAVPLALFLLRERQIAGGAGFPLDDSWIHLHFARNLAEGAGFSYNPGHPVAGSTAPLWTLLLALVAVVAGPSLVFATKIVGVVLTVAAALVLRRAALAWGAPPPVALASGAALLWTGPMAWGALSGMEVSLAALLVAATLLALAREDTSRFGAGTTALAGSLTALARPEALLLLPLLVLARRRSVRRVVLFAVTAAIVLVPAVLFSLVTVHAPIPATAAAKIEGGLVGWLRGAREPLRQLLLARPWEFTRSWLGWLTETHPALPLALLAVIPAWRRSEALGICGLGLVVHPLGMALLAPYREPAFQEGRYSMHLLPLAVLVLAIGVGAVVARAHRLALTAYLAIALVTLVPAATRYGRAVENIEHMQVRLGRWVAAHVSLSARLAVNDIGAIAYVSRREVIDLMGLVTPDIIPYRREGETGVMRYVARACPDYLIVFPAWFPRMTARADLYQPIHRVRLEDNLVAGADEMVVYRVTKCAL